MALIITPDVEQAIAEFASKVRKHDRVMMNDTGDQSTEMAAMLEAHENLKNEILLALEDAYYRKNGV